MTRPDLRPALLLPLLPLSLASCSGGGNITRTLDTVTVSVTDNGEQYTYQTTSSFTSQLMDAKTLPTPEKDLFDTLNAERIKGGTCTDPLTGKTTVNPPAPPLILEKHIHDATTAHASAMVQLDFAGHLNPFDPANRTPTRRMVNAGYKPVAPKQNSGQALFFEESLAYGFTTPGEVLRAWKEESYDHCMTIYTPLTYGAVAVKDGNHDAQGHLASKFDRYWVLNVSGRMPTQ